METEEETWLRCIETNNRNVPSGGWFEIAKLYRIERNKQLTTSKVGVIELSKEWIDATVHRDADPYSFIKGFETAIEILNK